MSSPGPCRVVWASCLGAPFASVVIDSYLAAGGRVPDHIILVPPDKRTASRLYSLALVASGTKFADLALLKDRAFRAGLRRGTESRREYQALPDVPVSDVESINSLDVRAIFRSSTVPAVLLASSLPEVLRGETLDELPLGALNLHLGRIPEYRGHFATYWEIRDRLPVGGVTVHRMATRVDAGPSLATAHVPMRGRSLLRITFEKKRLGGALLALALEKVLVATERVLAGTVDDAPLASPRGWPTLRDILAARLVG